MQTTISHHPDADAGSPKPSATNHDVPPRYGAKADVAAMLGLSKRSVDNLLRAGCPHLAIGTRRVRFDLGEVREWLRERYGVRRRGAGRRKEATR